MAWQCWAIGTMRAGSAQEPFGHLIRRPCSYGGTISQSFPRADTPARKTQRFDERGCRLSWKLSRWTARGSRLLPRTGPDGSGSRRGSQRRRLAVSMADLLAKRDCLQLESFGLLNTFDGLIVAIVAACHSCTMARLPSARAQVRWSPLSPRGRQRRGNRSAPAHLPRGLIGGWIRPGRRCHQVRRGLPVAASAARQPATR